MSPVSKAQQKATMKYMKNNYDRIELKVSKGKKADLQDHATSQGESLNSFVNRAIDNQVKQDRAVAAFTVQPADDTTTEGVDTNATDN